MFKKYKSFFADIDNQKKYAKWMHEILVREDNRLQDIKVSIAEAYKKEYNKNLETIKQEEIHKANENYEKNAL